MTGPELAAIRKRLGLSQYAMGQVLGLPGDRNSVQVTMSRYESGVIDIPTDRARLAEMVRRHGVPPEWAA